MNEDEVVSDFVLFGSPKLDGLSESNPILFGPILPGFREAFGVRDVLFAAFTANQS